MFRAEGFIKNYNTIEEFKNCDRKAIIEMCGKTVSCQADQAEADMDSCMMQSKTRLYIRVRHSWHRSHRYSLQT
jgi:hypothetical protein